MCFSHKMSLEGRIEHAGVSLRSSGKRYCGWHQLVKREPRSGRKSEQLTDEVSLTD